MRALLLTLALIATSAFAQAPQLTPDRVSDLISGLQAQRNEAMDKTVSLGAEVARLTRELAEAKKCEPKKEETK